MKEKLRNKMNKKFFNRCFRNRSRYSSIINLKSFNFFVILLFNDINQLTAKDKIKENKQIKISNTMRSYLMRCQLEI